MSYNYILDNFFHYFFLFLAIYAAVLFAAYYLKNKYIGKKINPWWYNIFFWGTIFIWPLTWVVLNPEFIGYGHPRGVDGVFAKNGKVYVTDYLLMASMRSNPPLSSKFSRIHILDAGSGNKILRFPTGEYGFLSEVKGDSIFFSHNEVVQIFSASNGKLISKWDQKSLPGIFPQLSAGIEGLRTYPLQKIVEISTLDAKEWYFSLLTGKLSAEDPGRPAGKYVPTNHWYFFNTDELKIDDQPNGTTLLRLDGDAVRKLKARNAPSGNNQEFLLGEFIAFSQKQNCVVVLSYETTKETGFILTGISLDNQTKLWELKKRDLRSDDEVKYRFTIAWGFSNDPDVLYFAMQDEVMAVEMATGKILWRQKL